MWLLVIALCFIVQLGFQGIKIIADWQILVIILFCLASICFRKSISLLRTEMTLLKRSSTETPVRRVHGAIILSVSQLVDGLVDEMPSLNLILWGWHNICGFVDCLVDEMAAFSADFFIDGITSAWEPEKSHCGQGRIHMWYAMWHRLKEI